MSKKMAVTKIEITTKEGVTIPLTVEEAKDLYKELKGLFGVWEDFPPHTPIIIREWPYPYRVTWTTGQWVSLPCHQQIKGQTQSGLGVSYQVNAVTSSPG